MVWGADGRVRNCTQNLRGPAHPVGRELPELSAQNPRLPSQGFPYKPGSWMARRTKRLTGLRVMSAIMIGCEGSASCALHRQGTPGRRISLANVSARHIRDL